MALTHCRFRMVEDIYLNLLSLLQLVCTVSSLNHVIFLLVSKPMLVSAIIGLRWAKADKK